MLSLPRSINSPDNLSEYRPKNRHNLFNLHRSIDRDLGFAVASTAHLAGANTSNSDLDSPSHSFQRHHTSRDPTSNYLDLGFVVASSASRAGANPSYSDLDPPSYSFQSHNITRDPRSIDLDLGFAVTSTASRARWIQIYGLRLPQQHPVLEQNHQTQIWIHLRIPFKGTIYQEIQTNPRITVNTHNQRESVILFIYKAPGSRVRGRFNGRPCRSNALNLDLIPERERGRRRIWRGGRDDTDLNSRERTWERWKMKAADLTSHLLN